MTVTFTRNVLLPGWILGFGLACLAAPAEGVLASLTLFLVGVFVIPLLVLHGTTQTAGSEVQ
jgi:hypothetical protein